MYILTLIQEDIETKLAIFDSLEDGREFVKKIPGYSFEEENGFTYETIDPKALPIYLEIEYRENILPLSRYMFTEEGPVEIFWIYLANMSISNPGLVDGTTRVDAYSVENKDLKTYIAKREDKYLAVKAYLESKNYIVERHYFGSEDGEAIVYKKSPKDNWHFLTHLDPFFVNEDFDESDIEDCLV